MIRCLIASVALATAASASAVEYYAVLDGAQEVPPVVTPASGKGRVTVMGSMLDLRLTWADLSAAPILAHIHCCAPVGANAGVAVDFTAIFPKVTGGSFSTSFDLDLASTYTPGFLAANGGTVAGAKARLLGAFDGSTAYFNIHTPTFPGGEIRGQITPVPEPATWALMILGFGTVGLALRRRPAYA